MYAEGLLRVIYEWNEAEMSEKRVFDEWVAG